MSNVPKLRFKEFSGEWEEKQIGKIFKISAGGDIKSENVSLVKTDEFKYPIYANAEKAKGLYGYANLYKSDANVITIAGRGVNIGIVHARKEPFYPIVRLLVLKPLIGSDIDFWEHQLNQLNLYIESTGVPQLTAPQIASYKTKYPSKQEQEKIASFLTSVDTKIEQLTKKEALLQQYKKGVMQKIFSQELRFKANDGSEFPKWEEKKFGEVFSFLRGSALSKSDLEDNGQNKCIHYGELFTTYREKISHIYSRTNLKDGQMSKVGDILMPSSDVTPQGLATASAIFEENVIIGGDTNILRPKKVINSLFVSYFLNSNKNEIMKIVTGTTVKHIYNKDVAKLIIYLPHIEEQTKIANFLSAIDAKIDLVAKQLDEAKNFKKGLLQQMFV